MAAVITPTEQNTNIDIDTNIIRFSQISVNSVFYDKQSIQTPYDKLNPKNKTHIEVLKLDAENFLAMDNRRLYNARFNNKESVSVTVCQLRDAVSEMHVDHDNDKVIVWWDPCDESGKLYKFDMFAACMEGVLKLRCASQGPHFPFDGVVSLPILGARTDVPNIGDSFRLRGQFKIGSHQIITEELTASVRNHGTLYIQPQDFNILHQRNDLRNLLFRDVDTGFGEVLNLNNCSIHEAKLILKAAGEVDEGDGWDDLNTAACEASWDKDDLYDKEFCERFAPIPVMPIVVSYTLKGAADLLPEELRRKEGFIVTHRSKNIKDALCKPNIQHISNVMSSTMRLLVGFSIDVVLLSNTTDFNASTLPKTITIDDETLVLDVPDESPTIELDEFDKCPDVIGNVCMSEETAYLDRIVIAFTIPQPEGSTENSGAIGVSLSHDLNVRLSLGTQQCFGKTKLGQRCKNRRRSSGEHAWCHHHLNQCAFYEAAKHGNCGGSEVPEWWGLGAADKSPM